MTSVTFKFFDPSTLSDGDSILLVGMRGSGKSTVAQSIMWHKKHLPYGICVNKSELAHKQWGDYFPSCVMFNYYSPARLSNLLKAQEELPKDEEGFPTQSCFFVADDLMTDDSFTHCKVFRELMLNGRHYRIFTLVTAQYSVGIPRMLRGNFNIVILLPEFKIRNREDFYLQFGGMFATFEEFNEVFSKLTEDDGCMVIRQSPFKPKSITDYIEWYKATPNLKYRVGCDELWEYSRMKESAVKNVVAVMRENPNVEFKRGDVSMRVIRKAPPPVNTKKKRHEDDEWEAEEPVLYCAPASISDMTKRYESTFGEKL